jgi:serine/threonine-protein kinase
MTEGHDLVGTTLAGKYRIRRLVGLGGMGAVYEGEHVELGKRIAVKVIDMASAASSELTTRFKREARAASAVESEHIVQVFDVGNDPDIGLYMVMEFLHGEDLEARLRRFEGRRIDPVMATIIGHQVARALVKAHAARVIHRDLKPANIFLTEREDGSLRVKVLDFGISKLLAGGDASNKKESFALTQEGVALGTPQYMSPEQAQGLMSLDHRTDVWSLGAVLYEAVAGRPAYPELPTYEEVIMKILFEKPLPLQEIAPWVPEPLAVVIHDALQHDVQRRIQDCAQLAQRLAQAVPEAVMGSTGPFHAARAMMASYSGFGALSPSVPMQRSARPATMPPDDTQVVIRSQSNPSFDEDVPSETMLANVPPKSGDAARSTAARRDGDGDGEGDDAPHSGGDPTMFQAPAWVGVGAGLDKEGPTTMKTGVAVRSVGEPVPPRSILTAAATALAVVVVGLVVLSLARSEPSSSAPGENDPAHGAATAGPPTPDPMETSTAAPAPPPTGTGADPVAPPPAPTELGGPDAAHKTPDGGAGAATVSPPGARRPPR